MENLVGRSGLKTDRCRLAFIGAVLAILLSSVGLLQTSQASAQDEGDPVVVDAACLPAPEPCASVIQDIIDNTVERPLVVSFGEGAPAGTTYSFNQIISPGTDVTIEGLNEPIVVGGAARLFALGGATNVTIRNFTVDMQACASTASVFFAPTNSTFDNVSVINVHAFNGNALALNPNSCDFFNSTAELGNNLVIDASSADLLNRFVWLKAGSVHTDVVISGNLVTEVEHSALNVDGYAEDVIIDGNTFSRHAPNARSGHMIGFQPSQNSNPDPSARNVQIRNNLIEGRPDTAHYRVGGVTQPTGGAADLIAVRGIDGFVVEDNTVRHSGEVGITATAGLRNGVIRRNVVAYTDTTGIVIGNQAADNLPVFEIDVYDNDLFHNGLDRLNELRPTGRSMPTISIWNANQTCVVNNNIHDNTISIGLWVYDGDSAAWPASVFDLYVEGNIFTNNQFDFVDSDHPIASSSSNGYQPASTAGGDYWTSNHPGLDADGDGFASHCESELDDSDPCVPYTTGIACDPTQGDVDADGVLDGADSCPLTQPAAPVGSNGCTDLDGDARYSDAAPAGPLFDTDDSDACTPDPAGVATGDCDGDGVMNSIDACEGSQPAEEVDPTTGCEPVEEPEIESVAVLIRAKGATGTERMKLALNNGYKATWHNVPTEMTTFIYESPQPVTVDEVRVAFTNKGKFRGEVKLLTVDYIEVGGIRYEAESPETYTAGSVEAGTTQCVAVGNVENDTLRCNGWFKFPMPFGTIIQGEYEQADADGDGVPDASDNCVDDPNPGQSDVDGDGVGDDCDLTPEGLDVDGDGFTSHGTPPDPDDGDACNPNPEAATCVPPPDTDGDGVTDDVDNCVDDPNPGQSDVDGDGVGDDCDLTPEGLDVDGDGFTTHGTPPDPDDGDPCNPDDSAPECAVPPNLITIRASGATGVERMRLALNGSYVATFQNVATDLTIYTHEVSGPIDLNEVRVNFTNKGKYRGQLKLLTVDYIEVNGIRYESESPATLASGSIAAGSTQCESLGYVENDTLRCNGAFRYAIPPGTSIG